MRFATPASAMKAMTSRRPAQRGGHSRTSTARTFRSSSDQGTRWRGDGRPGAGGSGAVSWKDGVSAPAAGWLEPPICGSRQRERAEGYAAFLRQRHPQAAVAVVEQGCPMRGE